MMSVRSGLVATVVVGASITAALPALAAPTVYADRGSFNAALGSSFTDGYDNANYGAGIAVRSDAAMSAVLGQTAYTSTGFPDHNFTFNQQYCAGCNGSFTLDFTKTSYGDASGVFGAAVDYNSNDGYSAFVTYGDGSSQNFALASSGFFGLTSTSSVRSIAFGLPNGGTTKGGYFVIDNLSVGSALAGAVPEPATWGMMILGMGAIGFAMRRRKNVSTSVSFA